MTGTAAAVHGGPAEAQRSKADTLDDKPHEDTGSLSLADEQSSGPFDGDRIAEAVTAETHQTHGNQSSS